MAFISSEGVIFQIEKLEPFTLQNVISHSTAKYVLELNQDFFQENDITVGSRVYLTNVAAVD